MAYGERRGFSGGPGRVPVNVGDELDVTIEAVGEKGDGIAKKDGFVLFVPNTREGDQIKVRVTKVLRKVGFAEKIGEAEEGAAEEAAPADEAPEASEDFGEEESTEPNEEVPADGDDAPAEDAPAEEAEEPAAEEEAPAEEEPKEE